MDALSLIINGILIPKFGSDLIDISKDKIEKIIKNNGKKHQNLESQIYNIIVDVLNIMTYGRYDNNQDKIYDATGTMLKAYKEKKQSETEIIKSCLHIIKQTVDENDCSEFKKKIIAQLSKDEYGELYRAVLLLQTEEKKQYDIDINEKFIQKLDKLSLVDYQKKDDDEISNVRKKVKNRAQEYADKWNENMFLNNFDKRDQNAGKNVKLSEVYLKEHLPHYFWCDNKKDEPLTDIEELLAEHINIKRDNKMLLILGQPGIGKSTLITWITSHFKDRIDDIFVYQFATDLKNINWICANITKEILNTLNLTYSDLENKTLILDGFDEVSIGYSRKEILDCLYRDLIYRKRVENFCLIITCRENYIDDLENVKSRYITLQPWDETQIKSFCDIFEEKTNNVISESTLEKLYANKEVLGIPLILYMVLALNISIEKESSIVDVYDKIFSLDGGIYDRCIDNKMFADKHRISEIKEQVHQISREIAIWMFENNPEDASISREEYEKICANNIKNQAGIIQDFKIGNYFKAVRHCEGVETEELSFIHRSIYEYFIVETIYSAIKDDIVALSEKSQEKCAGKIAVYLKEGEITETIGKFLQFKLLKLYTQLSHQ